MKKHITIIANWKMFIPFNETIKHITDNFDSLVTLSSKKNLSLFLAPTLPAIQELATIFKDTSVYWCSQDCSEHIAGAYTGQVSVDTLKAIGCHSCIIGHSERRKYNGETNENVANKLQVLLDYDLSPVVCIGEQEEEFNSKKTIPALEQQLKQILAVLSANQHKINGLKVYIAYEPIWSIDTGKVADYSQLETIYTWLFQQTQKLVPAINIHLLYGGSVNTRTIDLLKKINQLDGFLIGKASLDLQEFEKIVKCIMVER